MKDEKPSEEFKDLKDLIWLMFPKDLFGSCEEYGTAESIEEDGSFRRLLKAWAGGG